MKHNWYLHLKDKKTKQPVLQLRNDAVFMTHTLNWNAERVCICVCERVKYFIPGSFRQSRSKTCVSSRTSSGFEV